MNKLKSEHHLSPEQFAYVTKEQVGVRAPCSRIDNQAVLGVWDIEVQIHNLSTRPSCPHDITSTWTCTQVLV